MPLLVPWPAPRETPGKSHALNDVLNDRRAFLALAGRRHALVSPCLLYTSPSPRDKA